ncbi:MAG: hypothetical protein ACRCY8_19425 [Dermatophilaceae bacterium]
MTPPRLPVLDEAALPGPPDRQWPDAAARAGAGARGWATGGTFPAPHCLFIGRR